ncbi:MAG: hypothetical protein IT384_27300 [Deltaproteobacteria bacterium]|nr:hypothetical protein [Deltaproteobacteria bacterium]
MRGPALIVTVAAAVAVAACSEITDVFVPFPDHTGARALILVLSTPEHVSAEVIDLDSPSPPAAVFVGGGGREGALIEAVLYPLSLGELGLRPGPLTSTTSGGMALDAPATRFTRRQALRVDRGRELGPWQDSSGLSDPAAGLTIRGPRTRCARFVPTTELLPTTGGGVFSLPWGSDGALVGTERGDVYLASADRAERLTWTSTPAELASGLIIDGEDLWLGGSGGWLARARVDVGREILELIETSTAPSGDPLWYLSGLRTPEGVEIHALSHNGFIERYRGGLWTTLDDLPGGVGDRRSGGIATVAPGEAIVAWPASTAVFRVRGDAVTEEEVPTTEGLTGAAYIPAIGALVGDAVGRVFVDRGSGRWEPLGDAPRQYLLLTLVPYEDGFIAGSGTGDIVQFVPGEGYCPSLHLSSDNVRSLAVVGGNLISVENADGTALTPLVRARRTR